jgi:hypothetical protein
MAVSDDTEVWVVWHQYHHLDLIGVSTCVVGLRVITHCDSVFIRIQEVQPAAMMAVVGGLSQWWTDKARQWLCIFFEVKEKGV